MWRVVYQKMLLFQHHFAMLDLETAEWHM